MTIESPLADWSYSTEEWNSFVDLEKKNKKEDNLYFGVAILILAPLALMFLRGTSLWVGLLFGLPFAILIPFLRMKLAYTHLQKNISAPYVKIYNEKAVVNGKTIELASKRKRIKSVKIITTNTDMKLLEIDIQWITGKGPTNDEFRFPIPTGEESTAEHLVRLAKQ